MNKAHSLRDFQKDTKEMLIAGKSVLISAPTGLGKTRAAILPFVPQFNGKRKLSTRIMYTLPIRALSKGIQDEFKAFDVEPVIHHGEEPESEIFSERAIITTIDQYLTAFAGAPLSWASSASHAASGALLTSYTVFDEVHLLSPQKGLPLLFAVLKLRHRWNLPTTVMTATLPDSVIEFLTTHCGLEKAEASKSDVEERDAWREISLSFHDQEADISAFINLIKGKYENGQNKIIVFVNTVDKAVLVYRQLLELCSTHEMSIEQDQILLAHSRFTKKHRQGIEAEIHKRFGKGSHLTGILVTTQVAEAGLNISAPLVVTELSPMDSLIQRAGRCTRFKPESGKAKGEIIVVKPKDKDWFIPYVDSIVMRQKGKKSRSIKTSEITEWILKESNNEPIELNWNKERQLLNGALDDIYRIFIQGRDFVSFEENKDSGLWNIVEKHEERLEES